MNCSNCKGRSGQACPSLYGPAPAARPPSDTTPQMTTPPRLARHQDERRSSCAANASGSSAYCFTHISQGGLANDQPERTHRRPQTPQRSTTGDKMITKIIRKLFLICYRTNRKLPGKLNSFRVGNGNFENWKLFIRGSDKFEEKHTTTHITQRVSLDLLLSFLSSCLLIFLVFHLVLRVVSRLSSPLLSLSFCPLCLSVCLSPCVVVCVREGLCVVWGCVLCVMVCVWCECLW